MNADLVIGMMLNLPVLSLSDNRMMMDKHHLPSIDHKNTLLDRSRQMIYFLALMVAGDDDDKGVVFVEVWPLA